jgi:hypothetical protein
MQPLEPLCGRHSTNREPLTVNGFTLAIAPREIIIAHDMASDSAAIAPLLKADTATWTFSASKDGKLRVTYAEWDDARACASGAMVERGAP